jgi:hypothetical protein
MLICDKVQIGRESIVCDRFSLGSTPLVLYYNVQKGTSPQVYNLNPQGHTMSVPISTYNS